MRSTVSRRAARPLSLAASAHEHDEEVLELEDVGGRALTDSALSRPLPDVSDRGDDLPRSSTAPGRPSLGKKGELRVQLTAGELQALQKIADAHQTTVEGVAIDLIKAHLRWTRG